jgi:hypothetical protein
MIIDVVLVWVSWCDHHAELCLLRSDNHHISIQSSYSTILSDTWRDIILNDGNKSHLNTIRHSLRLWFRFGCYWHWRVLSHLQLHSPLHMQRSSIIRRCIRGITTINCRVVGWYKKSKKSSRLAVFLCQESSIYSYSYLWS